MPKKKLTRYDRLSAELKTFVRQYGRRAQKGIEPNDRRFSRKLQARIRRMKPEQLDQLLRVDPEAPN